MADKFDYSTAFSRNIGWVTTQEQAILRSKRVAIAGMGGVGGSHLLTLTRLGIGAFNIADFDTFELANFNRQVGAGIGSVGLPKVETLAAMARDINPEVDIKLFSDGILESNADEFLSDASIYIDGLDFFAVAARRRVFDACSKLGIPAVTAAPLGLGAAILNFLPGEMTFEEYFRLDGHSEEEQLLRFFVGLAPAMLQQGYLVDPRAINLAEHRGPSTSIGCELCAGGAASQALKILLNRGRVFAAPHGLQFDAYQNKVKHTWRPWGNNHPLQHLTLALSRRQIAKRTDIFTSQGAENLGIPIVMEQILDLARWAPSGDNTQPWRFEVIDELHLVVHGHDTRDHCVYDLQGHASQISLGALIESIEIAASQHQLFTSITRRIDTPETNPVFDVEFIHNKDLAQSLLAPYIPIRSVQRRPLKTRPLRQQERQQLEDSLGPGFRIFWLEGLSDRLRTARLLFRNAGLRLTMPEAYEVHRSIIQWDARYSEDRIPDQAVGVDPLTARLMRWTMKSWKRVSFMNRYLAGTLAPRVQLDLVPGIACAAHFVVLAEHRPDSVDGYVAAGRAVQRFWLTATRLGLHLQPEITPLVFHEYVMDNVTFSAAPGMVEKAQRVSSQLQELIGTQEAQHAVFMGRIGAGSPPSARSTRLPLSRLIIKNSASGSKVD